MFKDDADFEKIVGRLNTDTEPNPAHRENLRRRMLSVFNETSQQPQKRTMSLGVLRRTIMKSPITKLAAAAAIIIAVLICIHQLGGSIDGASIAWADVIEKLQDDINTTNTIHVLLTMRTEVPKPGENGEIESVEPHIFKGECWLRRNPFAGKMVLEGEQTNYFTENKFTGLDHRSKKWFEQSIPKEKAGKNMYGMFDALVTGDFKAHQKIPGFSISDGQVVGAETVGDKRATIYEFIGTPSEEKKEEGQPPIYFKCWVRDSDHRTVRMQTHYGELSKFSTDYELIEYDVTIPPGTLEVKIPEGYTKFLTQKERIRVNVPEDIIDLKQTYDRARGAFPNYRMVVLDNEGNIVRRVAKAGERWRIDNYVWRRGNKQLVDISKQVDFDSLWQRTEQLRYNIKVTSISYKKGTARGIWSREDLGNSARSRYQKHVKFCDIMNTVEDVAWPQMSLIGPDSKIEILHPSQEYPGCAGIRYSQKSKKKNKYHPEMALLLIWWIDPSKDYMCIRHERHQRKTAVWTGNLDWEPNEPVAAFDPRVRDNSIHHYHSTITKITASTLSPEGFWYPTEKQIQYHSINESGERVFPPGNQKIEKIYIDTQGLIDPNLFEWPEELPLPNK